MATSVLIVDDHPSFRSSARALLEAEGFSVLGEAEDGAAGIAGVRELRPDLVLLDVQLPDLDGFDVAARMAANGAAPAVILVSSRDRDDLGVQLSRSGARGFIPKSQLSAAGIRELLA